MSVRAPVGAVNIANSDCCIGRGLSAINSKKGSVTYIYYVIHYLKVRFDSLNTAGTTFGSITKDELFSLPVVIPSEKILERFEAICKPIFNKQMEIGFEIESLTRQRDELLPLLMNGQITVNSDFHDKPFVRMGLCPQWALLHHHRHCRPQKVVRRCPSLRYFVSA